MSERSITEQLTKYLADAHSIEVQALAQLERAPAIAGDEAIAQAFRTHVAETQGHERTLRERLRERGADASTLKDLAGRVGGWAMIVLARLNPDTPGKLVAHAYSYEHLELAAYELLGRIARRAGDGAVLESAEAIAAQERAMAARLAAEFDRAVEASLREKRSDGAQAELVSYLRDAHALESQALQLLQAGPGIAGCAALADALSEHLEQTREHQRRVEQRLRELDSRPSRLQDAALRIGGLNVGAFFGAQPDTPIKLAGFAFAFEHLEFAGYELLSRVADRAGDTRTASAAREIARDERAAAERIAASFDDAVEAGLRAVGVKLAAA